MFAYIPFVVPFHQAQMDLVVKGISICSSLTVNRVLMLVFGVSRNAGEFQARCWPAKSTHSNSVTNPRMFEFDIEQNRFIQIRRQTNSLESETDALKARHEKKSMRSNRGTNETTHLFDSRESD